VALRIGIVIGGRLVEERLWRERRAVTVGESQANAIVVPGAGRGAALFVPAGAADSDGWTLVLPDGASARIADDGGIRAAAQRDAIAPRARGRVVLGDVTILFQRVALPARTPRPRLPASVRAPLWSRVDGALATVLFVSLAIHVGCVGYLQTFDAPRHDWSVPPLPRYVPATFRMPAPKLPEKDPARPAGSATAAHHPARAPSARPAPVATPPVDAAVARARLADEVRHSGAMAVLTSRGEDGAVNDLLRSGYVAGDAEDVFARVGSVHVASGNAAPAIRGGNAPGDLKRGGQLRAGGPNTVATGDRGAEHAVDVDVTVKPPPPMPGPDGALVAALMHEVKQHVGGARACYELGMRHGEARGGTVRLRMTISPIGKVTEVEVEDDTLGDAEIQKCITSRVRNWRFTAPPREIQLDYDLVLVPVAR
jgi:TonB family protein